MGAGPVNANAMSGIVPIDISGMDLETALMAVQSQRAQMLESQLADQIKEVQSRNDKVSKFNRVLSELNIATSSLKNDAKSGDKVSDSWVKDHGANLATALTDAGLTLKGLALAGELKNITKGQLESAINTLKGEIDTLNNSQQMDMLRLQGLTNKRNEAFDVMSNFIKKMQDSRSSIIGNMR